MGKTTHHGLRKPDDTAFSNGSTTVSIGGLVKPKVELVPEQAPAPVASGTRPGDIGHAIEPKPEQTPVTAAPAFQMEKFPPSGYKPHPEDDIFYPRNPNHKPRVQ
jgi:hypothetical protein